MTAYLDGRVVVHAGDCADVLRTLADSSIDSVVTDPPYHLQSIVKRFGGPTAAPAQYGTNGAYARASTGFMGKQWDGGDIAFQPELWAEVLRVLKPGGHMLAFGGTRTYHRLACAIEDAGFAIRDCIMWVYGQGFPKSHDVSKGIDKAAGARGHDGTRFNAVGQQGERSTGGDKFRSDHPEYVKPRGLTPEAIIWEGWGTALKPSVEPICMARKPLEGTVAANVLKHGTGAINVDGCRIVAGDGDYDHPGDLTKRPMAVNSYMAAGQGALKVTQAPPNSLSRWPANLIHDGSDEVVAAFPETSSGSGDKGNKTIGAQGYGSNVNTFSHVYEGDSGSAARFFYAAKPDEQPQCTKERCYSPVACASFGYCRELNFPEGKRFHYSSKADSDDRLGSKHPTVKPVDLMQYLVRLVTAKGGLVLDPFAGTGTTAEAAVREGCSAVLIEHEPEYLADIERRCSLILAGPDTRLHATIKAKGRPEEPLPLFAEVRPQ